MGGGVSDPPTRFPNFYLIWGSPLLLGESWLMVRMAGECLVLVAPMRLLEIGLLIIIYACSFRLALILFNSGNLER
jgi:hypothetical protein